MMHVIIVHTLEHTQAALEAASELNAPVTLQSAPDAFFYAGALYLLTMYETAKRDWPQAESRFILDCADAGAEVIFALQMGHKHIRSRAPEEIRAKLADIASQLGVEMHESPYEALDLLAAGDTKVACKKWLKEDA